MTTLLLVEDNPGDEALTLRALRKRLCRQGRCHARRRRSVGLPLPQRIRANARTKLLPAVILTSSDEEGDSLAGYENGANSYVHKPVQDFVTAVQRLGGYWLELKCRSPGAPPGAGAGLMTAEDAALQLELSTARALDDA
jgi:two-component system, response regulator